MFITNDGMESKLVKLNIHFSHVLSFDSNPEKDPMLKVVLIDHGYSKGFSLGP